MEHLPFEILADISEYLENQNKRQDLLSFALTHRRIYPACLKNLFREATITILESSQDPIRHAAVLRNENHVRFLTISDGFVDKDKTYPTRPPDEAIARIYSRFPNITKLILKIPSFGLSQLRLSLNIILSTKERLEGLGLVVDINELEKQASELASCPAFVDKAELTDRLHDQVVAVAIAKIKTLAVEFKALPFRRMGYTHDCRDIYGNLAPVFQGFVAVLNSFAPSFATTKELGLKYLFDIQNCLDWDSEEERGVLELPSLESATLKVGNYDYPWGLPLSNTATNKLKNIVVLRMSEFYDCPYQLSETLERFKGLNMFAVEYKGDYLEGNGFQDLVKTWETIIQDMGSELEDLRYVDLRIPHWYEETGSLGHAVLRLTLSRSYDTDPAEPESSYEYLSIEVTADQDIAEFMDKYVNIEYDDMKTQRPI